MNSSSRRRCSVFRIPTAHPADTGGLAARLDSGAVAAGDIRAIFGKTEGNGCVNDFTRAYALSALENTLAGRLGCSASEVGRRVAMVMSGGTEGGLSPHLLIFTATAAPADARATHSLAIGTAFTRTFLPEEIGRMAQIEATAQAVAAAMAAPQAAGLLHLELESTARRPAATRAATAVVAWARAAPVVE